MLSLFFLCNTASATELLWNGNYRTRGQYFNTLSLSETNTLSEGISSGLTHRFRLMPTWKLDYKSSIHTQMDLLPYTNWGSEVSNYSDPMMATDLLQNSPLRNATLEQNSPIMVRRVWASYENNLGHLEFGRMPHHWGSGMLFHSGNEALSEFGNSIDRIQQTFYADDVFIQTSLDHYSEGLLNQDDDSWGGSLALMYNTERATSGVYALHQRQNESDSKFSMTTIDIHGRADAGTLKAEIEIAYQRGSGDIPGGINDITLSSFGGILDVNLTADRVRLGIVGGFAQGDSDPNDKTLKTFYFNPDYNLSLMLFEEPLPTLSSTSGLREYGAARTGYSLHSAMFGKPSITGILTKDLEGTFSVLAARAVGLTEEDAANNGYGYELNATLQYKPSEKIDFSAAAAYFIPGNYFTSYSTTDFGGNFNKNAIGLQLMGVARF